MVALYRDGPVKIDVKRTQPTQRRTGNAALDEALEEMGFGPRPSGWRRFWMKVRFWLVLIVAIALGVMFAIFTVYALFWLFIIGAAIALAAWLARLLLGPRRPL